jgi:dipeptidase D
MGRANALKWAAYILQENKEAIAGTPFRIGALSGGNAHNAVPSSCVVEVSVPADRALQYVEECKALFASLKSRWDHVEGPAPTMEISLLAAPSTADALTFSSSRTALRFVESLHHGIWAWSEEVATLVETSQSVSKAGIEGNVFWVEVFARSSKNPALAALARLLDAYAAMYNGKCVQHMDDMPGWPAEPTSRLCVAAQEVYRREFKAEAKVVPIHAGLECGIILSKFPKNEMQAISIGPTVANPHTINEFMELESCVKLYHYIAKLVEDLAK